VDEIYDINAENQRDLICTSQIGIAQIALYMLAVSFIAKAWIQSAVLVAILCITGPLIYFKWYIKLADQPTGLLVSELTEDLLEKPSSPSGTVRV
jgi:hypothetical protein